MFECERTHISHAVIEYKIKVPILLHASPREKDKSDCALSIDSLVALRLLSATRRYIYTYIYCANGKRIRDFISNRKYTHEEYIMHIQLVDWLFKCRRLGVFEMQQPAQHQSIILLNAKIITHTHAHNMFEYSFVMPQTQLSREFARFSRVGGDHHHHPRNIA